DGLGLRHDVELTPAVALERDPGRRLEARPEPAGRLADALRHGPNLAVPLSEDRDDAIGLTELDRAQHDPLVSVQTSHTHTSVILRRFRSDARAFGTRRWHRRGARGGSPARARR